MEGIDISSFARQKEKMDAQEARIRAPYRIAMGQALLDSEKLKEKWSEFVTESTNGMFHGSLLDETLEIMTMIKAGIPTETIKSVLAKMPNNRTIVTYLEAFFHPEIVSEIDLNNSMDKELD